MFDTELIVEILTQIGDAIGTVRTRFAPIRSVNDFLDTPEGLEKLDSICMKLIAIEKMILNLRSSEAIS